MVIFLIAEKENIVKILIENKPEIINVTSDFGQTPLLFAVRVNGKYFHLKRLLSDSKLASLENIFNHFVCSFNVGI